MFHASCRPIAARLSRTATEPPPSLSHFLAGQTPHSELYEVWLDGQRLAGCISASAAAGWATVYALDPSGMVARDGLSQPMVRRLSGQVAIRRVNDDPL